MCKLLDAAAPVLGSVWGTREVAMEEEDTLLVFGPKNPIRARLQEDGEFYGLTSV